MSGKIRIKRAVIVEGKYDVSKLSSLADAVIIKTDGFGIFKSKEKRDLIKRYASSSGLLILTDSDSAGRLIRNCIKSFVSSENIINAYIPRVKGKEKRKKTASKEGYLGVEGTDTDELRRILLRFEDEGAENPSFLTRTRLYDDGFFGKDDSSVRRKALLKHLGLPDMNVTDIINASGRIFSEEEYRAASRDAANEIDSTGFSSEKGVIYKMKTGLTSVSFRRLSAFDVADIAKIAGADGIEWGSDVHVPAGDIENAKKIAEKTRENGLEVLSYGSYYYLGCGMDFSAYLDTCLALGCRKMRIWAGKKERKAVTDDEYAALVEETKKIGALAAEKGVVISFEYHGGSLTSTAEDAVSFMKDVDMENVRLYWQRILNRSVEDNLSDLSLVAPYLTNVHVFNYVDGKQALLSEGTGIDEWKKFISVIKTIPGDRALMTEFCKGGLKDSYIADAGTLKNLVD